MNLALNSLQAMENGGTIRLTIREEGNGGVIEFSDTGPGISQEIRPYIFEPFFSNKEKGLGLGLAMSRTLIEQNGGTIELVESSEKGTTFVIRLPKHG